MLCWRNHKWRVQTMTFQDGDIAAMLGDVRGMANGCVVHHSGGRQVSQFWKRDEPTVYMSK
jgi:hypothetical protein